MKLKSLLIVVALLAALAGAVFVAQRPAPPAVADARLGQPLAERSAIEAAATLRLSDQGKSVTVVRGTDGTWRVPEYYGLPADFAKLSGFVASLTDARLQRLVTSSPERIARLEFKDAKIELLDAGGKLLWTVTLGKNAETGGGRYVRFGAENKAFLASLNAWLDPEPKNWADHQLLHLKPEEIAQVELPLGEGPPVVVSRPKPEAPWTSTATPAGQRVKTDRVTAIVNSLGTVHYSDTVEPSDAGLAAAKAHERAVRLTTFAGAAYTIVLSRTPEEKHLKPAAASLPNPEPAKDGAPSAADVATAEAAKPAAPEYETTPAGPVFLAITCSDATAPINGYMQKRAFQVGEYVYTGLPQKADDLFGPVPPAAPPAPAKKP